MQIRVKFFVLNENAAKLLRLPLWIPVRSPSRDMSSTPRKITHHKYPIQINDMPKVEVAIGRVFQSQLNTSEATLASNIEIYRYFRITYDTF